MHRYTKPLGGLSIELSVLTPTLSECGRAAAAADKLSAEVQQSEAADELIAPLPPDKPPLLLPLISSVLANDSATSRSLVPPPAPPFPEVSFCVCLHLVFGLFITANRRI
ncbi:unnamed protein product [Dibothriocephalus latus]|uniref:Uncharacterized protein n=1 Tax=Dibothriocephalus latus TaxID=60516 RepID=A0A3P7NZ61_DIBLA|nr:unnamed protein product [Dibothriocephalus latus]